MLKKIILTLGVLGLGLAAGGYYYLWHGRTINTEQLTFEVAKGASIIRASREMQKLGIIGNARIFSTLVRIAYRDKIIIKNGEYEITPHMPLKQLLANLNQGKLKKHKITIPEGLTTYEILKIIRDNPVLEGDINIAVTEGELLPETYVFYKGDTRDELILRMKQAMDTTLEVFWEARQPNLPLQSPRELLILASIIEKETSKVSEINRVASVFVNRLRINMRLQSCPTVIYALNQGRSSSLGRILNFDDLKYVSPYNTYNNGGLPPTPITNPGKRAIEAAANPDQTNYLFFVVDGTGGHHFSSNFAEHRQYANQYREKRTNSGMFIE